MTMGGNNDILKDIPDKEILLFKSCLVSTEYPGIESSTKYVFDKLAIEYIINLEQSCCTGLGHYSDIFDQLSTTLISARNFDLAIENKHSNIVTMCATCYAINKKTVKLLNNNDKVRNKINNIFKDAKIDREYKRDSINSKDNIFHVAEILYNKKDEIKNLINNNENALNNSKNIIIKKDNVDYNLSNLRIATHHACHYCKVFYEDTVSGVRNPKILDELVEACGMETIGWFNEKRTTCGAGFRQRFVNKDISLAVTTEKLSSLKHENADILIHMCPNCQMQFDRYQPYIEKKTNTDFKIIHLNIVQLIALVMGADPHKVIGIQTHTVPIHITNDLTIIKEKSSNVKNKVSK